MKPAHYLLLASMALLANCSSVKIESLETTFEISDGQETATYSDGIAWWKKLESASPHVKLMDIGETDAGKPLHLALICSNGNFSLEKIQQSDATIILINNGIHPGEPDGIDASMLFARDLVSTKDFKQKYEDIVFAIIPFYNVGGAINRNCCSRANQDGPTSYGFRGNARNLDLNRDFIKCDSKNAQSFNKLFAQLDPDIYLETHVSNGADYPYTMTYLASQSDKLGAELGAYVKGVLTPALFKSMAEKQDAMIPYVNVHGNSPDSGYAAFYDSPRYSAGYAALHHSIGLLTETHMLKPFKARVESTLRFLNSLAEFAASNSAAIQQARSKELNHMMEASEHIIDWELDSTSVTELTFNGYQVYHDTSKVTGMRQHYFNKDKPWQRTIPYLETMKGNASVEIPKAYLVPRAWTEVIDRLEWNGVSMERIEIDTTMDIVAYEIGDFDTPKSPYEGHYVHSNTQTERQYWSLKILANSYYLVPTNQKKKRFIIETLEPSSPDSYYNWNFFDEILQQKEWFSTYVFDKKAEEILENDSALARSFEEMKQGDSTFAQDAFYQLYYIYRNSENYERNRHNIYPVYRLE